MSLIDIAIFGIGLYASLLVLIAGLVARTARWINAKRLTGLYSVSIPSGQYGSSSALKEIVKRIFTFYTLNLSDKPLLVGSLMFHWGIWIALLGHLSMVIPPETVGISKELQKTLALYVGGTSGILAFIGLLILFARRLGRRDVRAISTADDYFALLLLLVLVGLGLALTFVIKPDYMSTVSKWLRGVLAGDLSAVSYISVEGPLVKLHVALAMLFAAYVPWGKMVHPLGLFLMPTVAGRSIGSFMYSHAANLIRRITR